MKEFVRAALAGSEMEAMMLKTYLESAGIEAHIRSFQIAGYDPESPAGIAPGLGTAIYGSWGEILVPRDQLEEAIRVISDIRNSI